MSLVSSDNKKITAIKDNLGNVLIDFRNTIIVQQELPIMFNSSGYNLTTYTIEGNSGGVGNYDSITQKYIIPITIKNKNLLNLNNIDIVDFYPDNANGTLTNATANCHSIVVPIKQGVYTFSINHPSGQPVRNRNRIACFENYPQLGDTCLTWTDTAVRTGDIVSINFSAPTNTNYAVIFLWAGNNPYTTELINNIIVNRQLMIEPGSALTTYVENAEQTIELSLNDPLFTNQYVSGPIDNNTIIQTYEGLNILTVDTTIKPLTVLLKGDIDYIDADNPTIYKIRYYNTNGNQLLYTEYIPAGGNANGWLRAPSKPKDQYEYTFVGWNLLTNQSTATQNVLNNITSDKDVYAAFSAVEASYTVKFINGTTLLQTVNNIPYQGTATYTGSTPVHPESPENYIFTGWLPSNTNIENDMVCYAQFQYVPQTIEDSWETIISNVNNGTYLNKYHVGDLKTIIANDGSVSIDMEIVAIDTDDKADNSGKAAITWISKQLLPYPYAIDSSSDLGWENSDIRSFIRAITTAYFPSNIQNAIVPVKKYSIIYDSENYTEALTIDTTWIPSYREIFGGSAHETHGPIYSQIFSNNTSRIKVIGNNTIGYWWWLRSVEGFDTYYRVSAEGSSGVGSNHQTTGTFAIGFCF